MTNVCHVKYMTNIIDKTKEGKRKNITKLCHMTGRTQAEWIKNRQSGG